MMAVCSLKRLIPISHLWIASLLAALACAAIAVAQTSENGNHKESAASTYSYQYDGARFYLSLIEVDLDAAGKGEIRFKRGEAEDLINLPVALRPETIARIQQLYNETDFLNSNADYQSKKDFSHLGWITVGAQAGERTRKVRFNYTTNLQIEELANIFRAIATQEIHLFDLETMQQYQPLDLPHQLESVETSLRLGNIAEPERIRLALQTLSGDDTLPLIARNKAARIVADIEKKKYKSPMKK